MDHFKTLKKTTFDDFGHDSYIPDGRIQFFLVLYIIDTKLPPVLQITFPVIVLIDIAAIRWWLGQT